MGEIGEYPSHAEWISKIAMMISDGLIEQSIDGIVWSIARDYFVATKPRTIIGSPEIFPRFRVQFIHQISIQIAIENWFVRQILDGVDNRYG